MTGLLSTDYVQRSFNLRNRILYAMYFFSAVSMAAVAQHAVQTHTTTTTHCIGGVSGTCGTSGKLNCG